MHYYLLIESDESCQLQSYWQQQRQQEQQQKGGLRGKKYPPAYSKPNPWVIGIIPFILLCACILNKQFRSV